MQVVTKTFNVHDLAHHDEVDGLINGWLRSLGNSIQRIEIHDALDVKGSWGSDNRCPLVRTVIVFCSPE